ncbi:cullin-like protein [Aureococcus anophagefferens]|nr:cullin-like protein [Aureococcus anophagefferens]
MNVFRLKTFDETWALLRRRLACVFDEALCDDVDPELPSKTETYNIVRDCCFIERWQEQLYAVCVPAPGARRGLGRPRRGRGRGRGRRRRAARRRRERVGLLEQAALPAAAGAAFAVEEETPDYAPGDPWADVLEGIEALDAMKALRRREREERDWAGRAVRGACEEAVNGEAVAARFARAVAAALDGELRSGGVGGARFEGALACFRLSRAKDAFEGRHRGLAANRLLDGVFGGGADLARALAAERALVATLEAECGASYVAKLEGMCKGAARAESAGPAVRAGAAELAPRPHGGLLAPAPPCALAPPPALAEMERAFEASYVAERKGRRLAWRPDLGRADVAADYGGALATLDATLAQALLLVALNSGAALSAGAAAAAGLDRATRSAPLRGRERRRRGRRRRLRRERGLPGPRAAARARGAVGRGRRRGDVEAKAARTASTPSTRRSCAS